MSADLRKYGIEHQDVPGVVEAKRLGMMWTPWMGDWFVSHSPRNGNSNAEGTWDHWVSLALSILQHPATELVRPEAHAAVQGVVNVAMYDETNRMLTDDEVDRLMGGAR